LPVYDFTATGSLAKQLFYFQDMKPVVMIIVGRMVIGGITMNTLDLIHRLRDEFRFILVAGAPERDEMEVDHLKHLLQEHECVYIPFLKRSVHLPDDIKAYTELKRLIRLYSPQIVHTIGAKPGLLGRLAAKRCGIKSIVHVYHGHLFHSYFNRVITAALIRLERRLAAISTRIVVISKSQEHDVVNVYRICEKDKITMIPVGIDLEKFNHHRQENRIRFRAQYLLADDEVAIGIVGRIVPIKNHLFFLHLAKEISRTTRLKARFFIVGDGPAQRKKLERYLKDHQIDHTYFPENEVSATVTFTSWKTDTEVVMAGLDIVALTSLNEGTPVSLMEAQAAGKPVITSNAGASAEVMINLVSGYLAELGDPADFLSKLILLARDSSLRKKMGEEGRKFILSRYNLDLQVRAMHRLYTSLSASGLQGVPARP
jgi:glycosyltransferase involved in cell wall biosynthesis